MIREALAMHYVSSNGSIASFLGIQYNIRSAIVLEVDSKHNYHNFDTLHFLRQLFWWTMWISKLSAAAMRCRTPTLQPLIHALPVISLGELLLTASKAWRPNQRKGENSPISWRQGCAQMRQSSFQADMILLDRVTVSGCRRTSSRENPNWAISIV